jgi:protein TonB
MFVPKFDIYNAEWLDLVFKDRNKSYGAYELRKHYTRTLFRSMGITALILLAVFLVALSRSEPGVISATPSTQSTYTIDLKKEITIERTNAQVTSVKHRHNGGTPIAIPVQPTGSAAVASTALTTTSNSVAVNSATKPNTTVTSAVPTVAATSSAVIDFADVMPEPNGGTDALNNFLKQNLQYPDAAAKNGISGQVIVSFVVETDGHLSDIKVTRSAGFGFDEEAVRVLKLAPTWIPGSQSGHTVRVRYSMPVNFRIIR